MAKGSFTVTLADGTQISGLGLNGNNFISDTPITPEMFSGKLSHVTITGSDNSGMGDLSVLGEHEHMELVQITRDKGDYWFILRELSQAELEKAKMQSDIAYMSMMTGIDLD
ncbi:MAG: hypothetical protein IJQ56_01220 [Synergistaceae bacterium]|nr:hypothetical protein [Synergistaceae bacterium]